jgi:hypothetical protein
VGAWRQSWAHLMCLCCAARSCAFQKVLVASLSGPAHQLRGASRLACVGECAELIQTHVTVMNAHTLQATGVQQALDDVSDVP